MKIRAFTYFRVRNDAYLIYGLILISSARTASLEGNLTGHSAVRIENGKLILMPLEAEDRSATEVI